MGKQNECKEGMDIDDKYVAKYTAWRGSQVCPWRDEIGYNNFPHSSHDFEIYNKETNEELFFPGLIVHLIREHHFYEGKDSPYRVDPEKAKRVLDIEWFYGLQRTRGAHAPWKIF